LLLSSAISGFAEHSIERDRTNADLHILSACCAGGWPEARGDWREALAAGPRRAGGWPEACWWLARRLSRPGASIEGIGGGREPLGARRATVSHANQLSETERMYSDQHYDGPSAIAANADTIAGPALVEILGRVARDSFSKGDDIARGSHNIAHGCGRNTGVYSCYY
jgi:hypothetical protein